jgi:hypothetical protein
MEINKELEAILEQVEVLVKLAYIQGKIDGVTPLAKLEKEKND